MRVTLVGFGSRGDVQPFAALAGGLARAGHRPTLAAPRRFVTLANDTVEFRGLDDGFLELQDEFAEAGPLAAITASRRFGPLMRRWLDDLAALLDVPTDVIIYHPKSLGAPHVAERLGVPSLPVQLIPMYESTTAFASPLAPAWCPAWANRLSWRMADAVEAPWRRALARWREEKLGLPGSGPSIREQVAWHGTLNVWSPEVLPAPDEWPLSSAPIGFLIERRASDWQPPIEVSTFLDDGEPPVYVGFGSMVPRNPTALLTAVTGALRAGRHRAILATGWGGLGDAAGGPNTLVIRSVPHDWLLPRVAVAVHHGGVGTFAAAARAGTPQVIRPFLGDQPFWARRAHELGVAPRPVTRTTARTLVDAIDAAAQCEPRAAELGSKLADEDAVAASISRIESLVRC